MDISLTQIMFWALAAAAVGAALGVVLSRNAIYSALCLVGTMFCLAGLFVLLNAQFLAAAQVIVYAGAVMVLFLFAIMLLQAGQVPGEERFTMQAALGWLFGIILAVQIGSLVFLGFNKQTHAHTSKTGGPTLTATETILPGASATVTVRDSYANPDPKAKDTINIEFILSPVGEAETITLTETAVNSDTFIGTIATKSNPVPGTPEDGVFHVQASQKITANYEDTHTGNYRTAVIRIRDHAMDMPAKITPGAPLEITLGAQAANLNPATADTVKIVLANSPMGERETLTLTETGPATGVFAGSLNIEYGTIAGKNNDGAMNAKGGDTITALYEPGDGDKIEASLADDDSFDADEDKPDVMAQAEVEYGNTEAVALTLFAKYIYPFEVIAVLLLIAMIGAVLIAKKKLKKATD
jgi:NADH-quinone oxidoreductase subunit J